MHDKFFTFSRAGGAENVTMVGSNNMTSYNAERAVDRRLHGRRNDAAIYFTYAGLFAQLEVRGQPVRRGPRLLPRSAIGG